MTNLVDLSVHADEEYKLYSRHDGPADVLESDLKLVSRRGEPSAAISDGSVAS
jgi:hypothetical protein